MIEEDPGEDRYPRELAGSYANLGAVYLSEHQPGTPPARNWIGRRT